MQLGDESAECRICLEKSIEPSKRDPGYLQNPELTRMLVQACKCRGSIRYVHELCLLRWLLEIESKKCDVCKAPLTMSDNKLSMYKLLKHVFRKFFGGECPFIGQTKNKFLNRLLRVAFVCILIWRIPESLDYFGSIILRILTICLEALKKAINNKIYKRIEKLEDQYNEDLDRNDQSNLQLFFLLTTWIIYVIVGIEKHLSSKFNCDKFTWIDIKNKLTRFFKHVIQAFVAWATVIEVYKIKAYYLEERDTKRAIRIFDAGDTDEYFHK